MSRITTVIFDMFNTLVEDGETFWNASFERIVTELGLGITGARLREVWATGDQAFRASRTQDNAPFCSYCDAWPPWGWTLPLAMLWTLSCRTWRRGRSNPTPRKR